MAKELAKTDHAGGGKARRDAHHIRFGDAAVEEALGIRLLKDTGLGGGREVGVQHDKVRVFRRQLLQGIAVALSGRNLS